MARRLWRLFWPLAASAMLMGTAEALVSAGLARVPRAEVALAAYGAVLAMSLLIEAPVIPMLHAANALVEDRGSFRRIFAFMLVLAVGCGALHAAVALTGLYGLVFAGGLHLPAAVVAAARPAMAAMIPWSPAIAWRRFFQGVLIRRGITRPIGAGTALRTITAGAVLLVGLLLDPAGGVTIGGAALAAGVSVEAAFITWAATHAGRLFADDRKATDLHLRSLLVFYLPLVMTAATTFLGRSVASAELARGVLPVLSLAAWPVATATLFLVQSPVMMVQQLVIARPEGVSLQALQRFALTIGGVASGVVAAAWLIGPLRLYFQAVIGVTGTVLVLAVQVTGVMVILPLLAAQQQYWQGRLVARRATWIVIVGSLANLTALTGSGLWAVTHTGFPAADAVAGATLLGYFAELGVLAVANRPAAVQLQAAASR